MYRIAIRMAKINLKHNLILNFTPHYIFLYVFLIPLEVHDQLPNALFATTMLQEPSARHNV